MNNINQLWTELKRRKVFRVLAMYAATAFIILEASDIMLPRLGLPDWTVTFVIILIIIGFPITAIVSWIFDITPEGLMKTIPLNEEKKKEIPIQPQPNKRLINANNIVITVLLAVVVILAYPKVFNANKTHIESGFEKKRIIAVLPFMNNTGDASNDHWEYGISELLIGALSTSNELTVIDNQTINEVVDNVESIQTVSIGPDIAKEVANRIKVNSYISGNYLLAGSTFRINLKLIDTKSSKVLKSEFVEGRADSIFAMVGSLANDIKNYLEIKVMGDDTDREKKDYVTTNSPEAYKYFIQGMETFWRGEWNAQQYFKEAINIDSTFTTAYIYLSISLTRAGNNTGSKEAILKANEGKDMLSKKMQLWLSAFMSQYIEKDDYKTGNYFKQVTELDPLSRLNWLWLGRYFMLNEDYEDALLSFEQILELNKQLGPWKNIYFYTYLGHTYEKQEKYNKAQKIYKEGLQLFHESLDIIRSQAICALLQNDTTLANHYIDQFNSAIIDRENPPEPFIRAMVGHIYKAAGQFKKAEELYRLALEVRLNQGNIIDTIHAGNHLFWYYDLLGNLLIDNDINVEEGMEYIQKALDLSKGSEFYSDHPKILSGLGSGYYKQGKYEEALQALKQAEAKLSFYNHSLHQLIQEVEQALANQNKMN